MATAFSLRPLAGPTVEPGGWQGLTQGMGLGGGGRTAE